MLIRITKENGLGYKVGEEYGGSKGFCLRLIEQGVAEEVLAELPKEDSKEERDDGETGNDDSSSRSQTTR